VKGGPRGRDANLWDAFEAAAYFDTAKRKKVDYIVRQGRDYAGF
jgi:hypothetical protein